MGGFSTAKDTEALRSFLPKLERRLAAIAGRGRLHPPTAADSLAPLLKDAERGLGTLPESPYVLRAPQFLETGMDQRLSWTTGVAFFNHCRQVAATWPELSPNVALLRLRLLACELMRASMGAMRVSEVDTGANDGTQLDVVRCYLSTGLVMHETLRAGDASDSVLGKLAEYALAQGIDEIIPPSKIVPLVRSAMGDTQEANEYCLVYFRAALELTSIQFRNTLRNNLQAKVTHESIIERLQRAAPLFEEATGPLRRDVRALVRGFAEKLASLAGGQDSAEEHAFLGRENTMLEHSLAYQDVLATSALASLPTDPAAETMDKDHMEQLSDKLFRAETLARSGNAPAAIAVLDKTPATIRSAPLYAMQRGRALVYVRIAELRTEEKIMATSERAQRAADQLLGDLESLVSLVRDQTTRILLSSNGPEALRVALDACKLVMRERGGSEDVYEATYGALYAALDQYTHAGSAMDGIQAVFVIGALVDGILALRDEQELPPASLSELVVQHVPALTDEQVLYVMRGIWNDALYWRSRSNGARAMWSAKLLDDVCANAAPKPKSTGASTSRTEAVRMFAWRANLAQAELALSNRDEDVTVSETVAEIRSAIARVDQVLAEITAAQALGSASLNDTTGSKDGTGVRGLHGAAVYIKLQLLQRGTMIDPDAQATIADLQELYASCMTDDKPDMTPLLNFREIVACAEDARRHGAIDAAICALEAAMSTPGAERESAFAKVLLAHHAAVLRLQVHGVLEDVLWGSGADAQATDTNDGRSQQPRRCSVADAISLLKALEHDALYALAAVETDRQGEEGAPAAAQDARSQTAGSVGFLSKLLWNVVSLLTAESADPSPGAETGLVRRPASSEGVATARARLLVLCARLARHERCLVDDSHFETRSKAYVRGTSALTAAACLELDCAASLLGGFLASASSSISTADEETAEALASHARRAVGALDASRELFPETGAAQSNGSSSAVAGALGNDGANGLGDKERVLRLVCSLFASLGSDDPDAAKMTSGQSQQKNAKDAKPNKGDSAKAVGGLVRRDMRLAVDTTKALDDAHSIGSDTLLAVAEIAKALRLRLTASTVARWVVRAEVEATTLAGGESANFVALGGALEILLALAENDEEVLGLADRVGKLEDKLSPSTLESAAVSVWERAMFRASCTSAEARSATVRLLGVAVVLMESACKADDGVRGRRASEVEAMRDALAEWVVGDSGGKADERSSTRAEPVAG